MLRRSSLRRRTALRPKKDPLKAYCWALLRAIVLKRDGYKCRKCGRWDVVLQVAHIRSRGARPSMAFLPENCLALCVRDHLYWMHKDPLEAARWLEETLPPKLLAKLDLISKTRSGRTNLREAKIALEQEARAIGVPLPPDL